MVAPTSFVKNIQAAEDNHFMYDLNIDEEDTNSFISFFIYSFFFFFLLF